MSVAPRHNHCAAGGSAGAYSRGLLVVLHGTGFACYLRENLCRVDARRWMTRFVAESVRAGIVSTIRPQH